MAIELGLGVVVTLAEKVALKLMTMFRNVKGTDAESRELQEFLKYLKANLSLHISPSEGAKIVQQSLEEAKTKMEEWTSKNSGFLARSSGERVQELQKIRRNVETAISMATFIMMNSVHGHMKAQNSPRKPAHSGHQGTPSASVASIGTGETIKKKPSEPKATSTRVSSTDPASHSRTAQSSSGGRDQHHSTKQQPSTSTNGGRKSPASTSQRQGISSPLGLGVKGLILPASSGTKFARSRPPRPGATAGRASQTGKLTKSDSKKQGESLWKYMWVPMDSEKQAKDIKESLLRIEGVKEAHPDQPSHKVSVLLHEGSNVKFNALLEAAQLKDKVKPTAWEKRPR